MYINLSQMFSDTELQISFKNSKELNIGLLINLNFLG